MYAVIDLETTGGRSSDDKIIEIAIILFDGEKIVDRYQTLIHPQTYIPSYITGITGIDDSMVVDAPKFYEVAKKIVEFTENTIFVAHNVGFDYGFLQAEFASLGFKFDRPKLCTVRASRKILPGHPTYSLGKLTQALGIPLFDRHRAMGDAEATVKLLQLLLKTDAEAVAKMAGGNVAKVPQGFPAERLTQMPQRPGVVYFHDTTGEVLFIEKAKNVRVAARKALEAMADSKHLIPQAEVADVSWEATGSLLLADLLARKELEIHAPKYNAKPATRKFPVSVLVYTDQNGYMRLQIAKKTGKLPTVASFLNESEAKLILRRRSAAFGLCGVLTGLESPPGPCSNYPQTCKGACTGHESAEAYNARVQTALEAIEYPSAKFLIMEDGRTRNEFSAICFENGICTGYGFFDREDSAFSDPAQLAESLQPLKPNPALTVIIRQYLRTMPAGRIVPWN